MANLAEDACKLIQMCRYSNFDTVEIKQVISGLDKIARLELQSLLSHKLRSGAGAATDRFVQSLAICIEKGGRFDREVVMACTAVIRSTSVSQDAVFWASLLMIIRSPCVDFMREEIRSALNYAINGPLTGFTARSNICRKLELMAMADNSYELYLRGDLIVDMDLVNQVIDSHPLLQGRIGDDDVKTFVKTLVRSHGLARRDIPFDHGSKRTIFVDGGCPLILETELFVVWYWRWRFSPETGKWALVSAKFSNDKTF